MKEFVISRNEAGQRFDKYIAKILPVATGAFYYKMLRKKNITLNGKKADGREKIMEGDVVRFFLSDETFDKFAGSFQKKKANGCIISDFDQSGLTVLYEDEDILAFDKPSGMLSQKANPSDLSVNDYLLSYLAKEDHYGSDSFRPSICNRLDRNTSGIILCSKSMTGSIELGRMLKDRSLSKYYRCIVLGDLKEDRLTGFLRKDERTNKITFSEKEFEGSSPIETSWKPISTFQLKGHICTELEVHLITGKTHQIRGHLAGIGHPILGDHKYGNSRINEICKQQFGIKSQLLHAYKVIFPADTGKLVQCQKLVITAPLPKKLVIVKGF